MIYKSQFTGAEIDDGITKAREALTATDQNSERIQLLEADNENIKTQIGALDVRLDNVENTANTAKTTADSALSTANIAKTTADSALSTANTAKTTADSALSTAQSASSTANEALTATGQNSERIQILETDNESIKTQVGALDVRLDNVEITANKALVKPDSAPASTSLVAVNNSNVQTMLAVGDGLSIENGVLKAAGGGGGGGGSGTQLYKHHFVFPTNRLVTVMTNLDATSTSSYGLNTMDIISTSDTPITSLDYAMWDPEWIGVYASIDVGSDEYYNGPVGLTSSLEGTYSYFSVVFYHPSTTFRFANFNLAGQTLVDTVTPL